jgi:polyhydroxyalkanoate synthesis regulator phasin
MIRNALLAGLGAQEKVSELINELVKKGELSESQGAKLVKEWAEKAELNTEDISKSVNDVIKQTLEKMKLPSKADIDALSEKINEVAERVSKLEGGK